MGAILDRSCQDCQPSRTTWPWYSVKDTGEIVELPWVDDLPASQCVVLYENLAEMSKELDEKE